MSFTYTIEFTDEDAMSEWLRDRFRSFDISEVAAMHHALRMIITHPLTDDASAKLYKALADEAWAKICGPGPNI